jgi:hypothetical protein
MKPNLPLCALAASLLVAPGFAQQIPEELLDDEHVREELGVNRFTTPSIKRLFEDLDDLGTLPYEKLKRDLPKSVDRDRSKVALTLGTLISEGFLVVQTEKVSELEDVGRIILKQAKVLGAGMRVTKHTKSILENSTLGEWDKLKEELAKTQKDVEGEMVLLRDVDIAHLVSLGGWLRAFEIAAVTASDPYSEKKAEKLCRNELIAYFIQTLQGLEPTLSERPHIITLVEGLEEILAELGGFDPEAEAKAEEQAKVIPNAEQTAALAKKAHNLVKLIGGE